MVNRVLAVLMALLAPCLARPTSHAQAKLTPGTTALLVDPKDKRDVDMVGVALNDPDGRVRAVAARVAFSVVRISRRSC